MTWVIEAFDNGTESLVWEGDLTAEWEEISSVLGLDVSDNPKGNSIPLSEEQLVKLSRFIRKGSPLPAGRMALFLTEYEQ